MLTGCCAEQGGLRLTGQQRFGSHLWCEWQHGLHRGLRSDEGDKLAVDDLHLVRLLGHKLGKQGVRNGLCILGRGCGPQLKGACNTPPCEPTAGKTAACRLCLQVANLQCCIYLTGA